MILYERFMLGLIKPQDLTSEQFDELIHFERSSVSLSEMSAVVMGKNPNSFFIDIELLKTVYFPENYTMVAEAEEPWKNSSKFTKSSSQFMANPEIYRKTVGKPGEFNPFARSVSTGKFDFRPSGAHHPDRSKLHKPGMDFDHETLSKIEKHPKKISPEEHDEIKKDYSEVNHPERKFNVQVHGDVRTHLHPETSQLKDDHRHHLIKALQHLASNGHGQNPGEEIDDEKHGKDFQKLNKDKSDFFDTEGLDLSKAVKKGAEMVNKTPLRHFHIPDVPDHPSNVGKFRDKSDKTSGHYQVSYHYSPKSNTYYIHKVNSHNLVDDNEGGQATSYYQAAAQQHTLSNKQHMLESVKLFQQRYLEKLLKSFL